MHGPASYTRSQLSKDLISLSRQTLNSETILYFRARDVVAIICAYLQIITTVYFHAPKSSLTGK